MYRYDDEVCIVTDLKGDLWVMRCKELMLNDFDDDCESLCGKGRGRCARWLDADDE